MVKSYSTSTCSVQYSAVPASGTKNLNPGDAHAESRTEQDARLHAGGCNCAVRSISAKWSSVGCSAPFETNSNLTQYQRTGYYSRTPCALRLGWAINVTSHESGYRTGSRVRVSRD